MPDLRFVLSCDGPNDYRLDVYAHELALPMPTPVASVALTAKSLEDLAHLLERSVSLIPNEEV
jgi:hypothetical protein